MLSRKASRDEIQHLLLGGEFDRCKFPEEEVVRAHEVDPHILGVNQSSRISVSMNRPALPNIAVKSLY